VPIQEPIQLCRAIRLPIPLGLGTAETEPVGSGTINLLLLPGLLADFSQIDDFAHEPIRRPELSHGTNRALRQHRHRGPRGGQNTIAELTVFFSAAQDTVR